MEIFLEDMRYLASNCIIKIILSHLKQHMRCFPIGTIFTTSLKDIAY